MRNFVNKINGFGYRLMAGSLLSTLAFSGSAHAQGAVTNVGGIATNLSTQFGAIGKAVLGGSFIGGVGLVGAGLLKLKAAADAGGQQVKYSEGLWRIAVGSGMVALPTMATIGSGSLFGSGATNTVNAATTTNSMGFN